MSNYENDPDFLDMLAAWHENKNLSPARKKELLERLEQDSGLRLGLAREIEMAGLTRVAQTGEPRWLELEDKLGAEKETSPDFEFEVMKRLQPNTPGYGISSILTFPKLAGLGIAVALVFAFLHLLKNEPVEEEVAKLIRLEGIAKPVDKERVLHKGEEFAIEEGLVEMAFRETGVHLIGTGPLNMTLLGNDRIFLNEGEIKLVVPPQGIGFVVDTLDRKFVDLGTSFVVQASKEGSKVLVLEGEIAVGARNDKPTQLMSKGSTADFDRNGSVKLRARGPSGVPELSLPPMTLTENSLTGKIYGIKEGAFPATTEKEKIKKRAIVRNFVPLVRSGFSNQSRFKNFVQGRPLRFTGIAGTYDNFPMRTSLAPYSVESGWLAWYSGQVKAPKTGRYRFWGYADNNLLVAINQKPVFEGSRYDSHFQNELKVPRKNHPFLPCLNARAGFASGKWFEVGDETVRIDLLFGESSMTMTSGLLLIEYQKDSYEKTYWGQPQWPLFLTEFPQEKQLAELDELRIHMEEKIKGSFSVSQDSIWQVASDS
ncbi:MAG: hypothetical protein HN675_00885 [Opitutae bacterium]|jgi:hypothetical protein|nr:hypothetical protein [Opitutae bacterium]MBT5689877.1 hypothetical protein [Opitutae bacterium]MBT7851848.1 hypothetical protein [Opitutae bacterium]